MLRQFSFDAERREMEARNLVSSFGVPGSLSEGYCYLSVVKEQYRSDVLELVGKNPLVWVFLYAVESYQLDEEKLQKYGWYEGFDVATGRKVYHIGSSGRGRRLAAVADVIKGAMGSSAPIASRLMSQITPVQVDLPRDCCLGQDVPEVGPLSVHSSLAELRAVDFAQCFCKIHASPVTSEQDFASEGCCKRPAGASAVIAAAFRSENRMCHAEPAVRLADSRFVMAVSSGNDPGILDGALRPDWFASLCTSNVHNDRGVFGNGYCYLDAMQKDTWWRCARVLGPNPAVLAVANVLVWAGKVSAKPMTLKRVKEGFYHLVVDKQYKGVHARAGRRLYDELLALVAIDPDARMGLEERDSVDGRSPDQQRLFSSIEVFRAAMKCPQGGPALVVMFPEGGSFCPSGTVVADVPVGCIPLTVGTVASGTVSFCVKATTLSALVLPVGCLLYHNDVVYGAAGVQVIAVVSGTLMLYLQAPAGCSSLCYGVITPEHYAVRRAVERYCYDPRSTEARFVRLMGAPLVLRCPSRQLDLARVVPFCTVAITDPLADWEAVMETRLESGAARCGDVLCLDLFGAINLSAFRYGSHEVRALIDGCVRLDEKGDGVSFLQSPACFELVPYEERDAGLHLVSDGDPVEWSVRVKQVRDEYCMDNGGPSDSDYSDCY